MKSYSEADLKEPIWSISILAGLKKIIKLKKKIIKLNLLKLDLFCEQISFILAVYDKNKNIIGRKIVFQ